MKKKYNKWIYDYLPWVIVGLLYLVFMYSIFGVG